MINERFVIKELSDSWNTVLYAIKDKMAKVVIYHLYQIKFYFSSMFVNFQLT